MFDVVSVICASLYGPHSPCAALVVQAVPDEGAGEGAEDDGAGVGAGVAGADDDGAGVGVCEAGADDGIGVGAGEPVGGPTGTG